MTRILCMQEQICYQALWIVTKRGMVLSPSKVVEKTINVDDQNQEKRSKRIKDRLARRDTDVILYTDATDQFDTGNVQKKKKRK